MDKNEIFFNKIKQKLIAVCPKCNASGKIDGIQCDCMNKFEMYVQYYFRGIPPTYWDLTFDDWKKDGATMAMIVDYIAHLDNALGYGLSILFSGSNGVGKSMLMNIILKEAFAKGYKIQYLDARRLIDKNIDFNTADFLALDNLGDEQEFFNKDVYTGKIKQLVWSRVSAMKPTLIATNLTVDKINELYGKTVHSYVVNTFKVITLAGQDYRTIMKNNWEALLLE